MTQEERKDTKATNTLLKWWDKTQPDERLEQAVIRSGAKPALFNWSKLSSKVPAKSLVATAVDMISHWSECRSLTFREWKRLGSFPDDYHAKTDKIGKYMIGMSVPPKMTEQVARAVIQQWLQP